MFKSRKKTIFFYYTKAQIMLYYQQILLKITVSLLDF